MYVNGIDMLLLVHFNLRSMKYEKLRKIENRLSNRGGGARALPIIALLSISTVAIASEQQSHVEEFKGIRSLRTENICANVEIQTLPEATDVAFVTISGDKDLEKYLKTLKISADNGCLSLRDESGNGGGSTIIMGGMTITGGSRTIISGGNIMMGGGGRIIVDGVDVTQAAKAQATTMPTIKLVLSQHLPMKLSGLAGTWNIGDTNGTFTALLKGSCKMLASQICADAEVDISGAGEFKAVAIKGDEFESSISGSGDVKVGTAILKNAKFSGSGSGDVRINEGTISNKLVASVSGSGDMKLNCSAKDAKLKVSGSGTIKVTEVTGELDRMTSGSGKVKVGNRPEDKSKKKQNAGSTVIISNGYGVTSMSGVVINGRDLSEVIRNATRGNNNNSNNK